jgi:hypothetical protein
MPPKTRNSPNKTTSKAATPTKKRKMNSLQWKVVHSPRKIMESLEDNNNVVILKKSQLEVIRNNEQLKDPVGLSSSTIG